MAATLVVLGCALSAYLSSADWGDGRDHGSAGEYVALAATAILTTGAAVWLTRRLR